MKQPPILNKARILHLVYDRKSTSNSDITRELDLSLPTVLQHIKELRAAGLIQTAGKRASTGGRRANELTGVPLCKVFGGIEISRHHFTMVIVDLFSTVIAMERRDIPFSVDEEYLLALHTKFLEFIHKSGYEMRDMQSIGLAMPGVVSHEQRGIYSSRVLNLHNTLLDTIQSVFDAPSRFYRGSYASGYAELRRFGRDKTMAYLSLGASVNLAFFRDGQFYSGQNNRAGTLAHSTLYPNGRTCYCGREGCVVTYLSSDVLCEFGTLDDFFDNLDKGEEKYVRLWDVYTHDLAMLLDNVLNTYDCDVIIGGYVGFRMAKYLEQMRGSLRYNGFFKGNEALIHIGSYSHGVAAIGAAILQADEYIDHIDDLFGREIEALL